MVRVALVALLAAAASLLPGTGGAETAFAGGSSTDWMAVETKGAELRCLTGRGVGGIALVSCREECEPIPWQLDERHADGSFALDEGPEPDPDDSPGVVDSDDEIVCMLSDFGRRMRPSERPAGAGCVVEIGAERGPARGFVYALALPSPAPRSNVRYVDYDAALDRMRGARVSVGFAASTPRWLAFGADPAEGGRNLLDRLKVRAGARFFGLVPLSRSEDDIETERVAWRAGPVRIIRRQRQWVRLGFGLRSPVFRSDTLFYRDFGVLPVRLRLNFRANFFFRAIEIQALLDFRDLNGWDVVVPERPGRFVVGDAGTRGVRSLAGLAADWFALRGPDVTLVQRLVMGPTLASVRREILVRDGPNAHPPEDVAGERPGIGWRLTRWEQVDSGAHHFSTVSFALAPDEDLGRFAREIDLPLRVETREVDRARPAGRSLPAPR